MAFITILGAQKNEAEKISLNRVTEQYKVPLWHRWKAIFMCAVEYNVIILGKRNEEDEILDIAEIENYQNDFIRMGFNGGNWPASVNWWIWTVCIWKHPSGRGKVIQDTIERPGRWFPIPCGDRFDDGYIIYGVPLFTRKETLGVLTFASEYESFEKIIQRPIFNGSAYLHIPASSNGISSVPACMIESRLPEYFWYGSSGSRGEENLLSFSWKQERDILPVFTRNNTKFWCFAPY